MQPCGLAIINQSALLWQDDHGVITVAFALVLVVYHTLGKLVLQSEQSCLLPPLTTALSTTTASNNTLMIWVYGPLEVPPGAKNQNACDWPSLLFAKHNSNRTC
jgi:hypothetical protein